MCTVMFFRHFHYDRDSFEVFRYIRIYPLFSEYEGVGTSAHCILVDASIVICSTSPFVILGWRVFYVAFVLMLMDTPVSKQCRP